MNHNTPTTDSEAIVFNSLNDIVPDFPLTPHEVLLLENPGGEAHILIPNSIIPTAPDGPRYAVGVLYVKVLEHSDDTTIVSNTVSKTQEYAISKFGDLIDTENVITRDQYTTPPSTDSNHATLYFDGASRGNPGPAASAYCLDIDAEATDVENGMYINKKTNNVAEYVALVQGLIDARNRDICNITIYGDSELIIKQIKGEYDCNSDNLSGHHENALNLLDGFESWTIEHVPREENNKADAIANITLNRKSPGRVSLIDEENDL